MIFPTGKYRGNNIKEEDENAMIEAKNFEPKRER